MINKFKKNKGFTLVEMIIAIGIFAVIATFAIGAILSIFDANRRAQSSKTVVDNLNFAIENMTRTVRFGGNYYCGISYDNTEPIATSNCSGGDTALSVTFEGARVVYRLNSTTIEKTSNGSSNYQAITAPEVVVEHLRFYVLGAGDSDLEQPYAVAVIKGYVGNKPTAQSSFSIQTTMSQRALDI